MTHKRDPIFAFYTFVLVKVMKDKIKSEKPGASLDVQNDLLSSFFPLLNSKAFYHVHVKKSI